MSVEREHRHLFGWRGREYKFLGGEHNSKVSKPGINSSQAFSF